MYFMIPMGQWLSHECCSRCAHAMLPESKRRHVSRRTHRSRHLSRLRNGALGFAFGHGGLITQQAGTADRSTTSHETLFTFSNTKRNVDARSDECG
jgi:hypothetical protein